jgi:metal-responsive CopG/Arc/MetJ family transcriptional regulator
MRKEYTTVKVPTELAKRLDIAVKDMGYTSRADVVNDAIRHFIESIHKETESKTKKILENQVPLIQA